MRRLLTHLAQFGSFGRQGELLCTQGLVHLLQHDEARAVFAKYLEREAKAAFAPDLTWHAEVRHTEDLDRPDLEACSGDKTQVAKIEAKLDAALLPDQLLSYVNDIERRCGDGRLLVLIPRRRAAEAANVAKAFAFTESSPWRRESGCSVAVIFWEGVIEALRAVPADAFQGDLEQFEAMFKVLNRHIQPLADDVEAQERQEDLVVLINRLTRRFAEVRHVRLLPMSEEVEVGGDGRAVTYQRRYMCLPLGDAEPCFSVGVRHPFAGQKTFIWLRFHRVTPRFALIRGRLACSAFRNQLGDSGGHLWLPLNLPLHTEEDGMVASLYAELEHITQVAYAPLADQRSPSPMALGDVS